MDTSEQYIQMCERAEEIQRYGRSRPVGYYGYWQPGDFYFRKGEDEVKVYEEIAADEGYYSNNRLDSAIWLPRQDQLQEMGKDKGQPSDYGLIARMYQFVFGDGADFNDHQCYSMEQLWLAFVMKELYGKVWSGEEWQSEK